ncbi:DUF4198 domain-containing protein [Sphingomonas sp. ID0503]|uniref:DUF4198 domain-containing protein n=1 Tax=Sphingomonas sp. ID0503 TaxID=3399691 RepID=UPI003AFB1621
MKLRLILAALAATTLLATPAAAHRQWILPSSTVLSGDDAWVTFDAAVSNELFYFDHNPMRLDGIKVYAPDGSAAAVENASTGKFRSTFDLHLTHKGTYKVVSAMSGVMGSYTLNGETKRLPRGTTKENLAAAIPAGATNVRTGEMSSRNEVFVTSGAPTTTVFKATGTGLEMVPVTHPNDLVAGEAATFQFVLDGKPASGITVTVVPGGGRYRGDLKPMELKTDGEGKVAINWPEAGMYWLNASIGGSPEGGAPRADGPLPRRASYVATLEVLAP